MDLTREEERLSEAPSGAPWRKWGPYLSERQWGTVREDYSADGDAWDYFPHDHARSRAYRWGEDGLAGICDDQQRLCFALALWNGRDPILKERLFGLTSAEGNHGEDVKEYYYYLDSTPTHSYHAVRSTSIRRRVSVRRPGRRRTARGRDRPRVRAARHRRLRRGPLLRRRGRVRQGRPETTSHPHHGPQPRTRRRRPPPTADAVVPQHVVAGATPSAPKPSLTPSPDRGVERRRAPRARRRWHLHEPGDAAAAIHRERDERERLWGARTDAVLEGRLPRLRRHGEPAAVNPASAAPRVPRTTARHGGRRRDQACACG